MATKYERTIRRIEKKAGQLNFTPQTAHLLAVVLYEIGSRPAAERDNALTAINNMIRGVAET